MGHKELRGNFMFCNHEHSTIADTNYRNNYERTFRKKISDTLNNKTNSKYDVSGEITTERMHSLGNRTSN